MFFHEARRTVLGVQVGQGRRSSCGRGSHPCSTIDIWALSILWYIKSLSLISSKFVSPLRTLASPLEKGDPMALGGKRQAKAFQESKWLFSSSELQVHFDPRNEWNTVLWCFIIWHGGCFITENGEEGRTAHRICILDYRHWKKPDGAVRNWKKRAWPSYLALKKKSHHSLYGNLSPL